MINPMGTSVIHAAVTTTRALPTTVSPGQTFDVTITFTAPANGFLAALGDFAPTGWTVAVDITWCTPPPWKSNRPVPNKAEYLWSDPANQGTAFTAVYKVTVPSDAPAGNYNFTNGTLEYYIGGTGPTILNVGGASKVEVVEGARIQGETWEVKGIILGNVTLTLDGATSVVSGTDGTYQLTATTLGVHTIVASKAGFRDQTRTINVDNLGTTYTLKFKGIYGLVPNAADMSYALACVVKWQFTPADAELGLNMSKVLAVVVAWQFPITQ